MIYRILTPHASMYNKPLSTSYNNLKTHCENKMSHQYTLIVCFRKQTSEIMDIVTAQGHGFIIQPFSPLSTTCGRMLQLIRSQV